MSALPPKADIVQHVGGSRDCAGRRRNVRGVASDLVKTKTRARWARNSAAMPRGLRAVSQLLRSNRTSELTRTKQNTYIFSQHRNVVAAIRRKNPALSYTEV